MFLLPVSGTPVSLHAPNGHDDMLLAERRANDPLLRVSVVRRLAVPAPSDCDWGSLPYVDVDAALLALRQQLGGDRIVAEVQCAACGADGDLELSIGAYLHSRRPRERDDAVCVLTVDDVVHAVEEHGTNAAGALESSFAKHTDPTELTRSLRRLERVAPIISGPVTGTCPRCGAGIAAWFDPGAFVLDELRGRATRLAEDVHLLASAYGWSEDEILALPRGRRTTYAERIATERRQQ